MPFEQSVPRREDSVLCFRSRFLLEKYRTSQGVWSFRKSLRDKAQRIPIEVFDQRRVAPLSRLINKCKQVAFMVEEYDPAEKAFRFWQKRQFHLGNNTERSLAAD